MSGKAIDKSEAQGRIVRLEATTIITDKNKQPFTKCFWKKVTDEVQENASKLHELAGFTAN